LPAQLDFAFPNPPSDLVKGRGGRLVAPTPAVVQPDPDRIRSRLNSYLVQLASGAATAADRRNYLAIVPNMVLALPADEAKRFLARFGLTATN
jgi:hypothetical protein